MSKVGKPLHGKRPKEHFKTRIDADLIDRMREYRDANNIPIAQLTERAITEFLSRQKKARN